MAAPYRRASNEKIDASPRFSGGAVVVTALRQHLSERLKDHPTVVGGVQMNDERGTNVFADGGGLDDAIGRLAHGFEG
jgi:hypothetical protein